MCADRAVGQLTLPLHGGEFHLFALGLAHFHCPGRGDASGDAFAQPASAFAVQAVLGHRSQTSTHPPLTAARSLLPSLSGSQGKINFLPLDSPLEQVGAAPQARFTSCSLEGGELHPMSEV